MKKILLSIVGIAAMAAVGVGATTAYFSDTETSVGNVFAAGKLDLELGATNTLPFNIPNAVPGQSGTSIITLTNTVGSIPGKLNINLTNIVQDENDLTEPEIHPGYGTADYPGPGELGLFLEFAAFVDVNKNGIFDAGDIQITYNGQQRDYPGFWPSEGFHYHGINSMMSAPWNNIITMNDSDSVNLVILWQFPTESHDSNYSQNIAMTDSMTFDVVASLTQTQ